VRRSPAALTSSSMSSSSCTSPRTRTLLVCTWLVRGPPEGTSGSWCRRADSRAASMSLARSSWADDIEARRRRTWIELRAPVPSLVRSASALAGRDSEEATVPAIRPTRVAALAPPKKEATAAMELASRPIPCSLPLTGAGGPSWARGARAWEVTLPRDLERPRCDPSAISKCAGHQLSSRTTRSSGKTKYQKPRTRVRVTRAPTRDALARLRVGFRWSVSLSFRCMVALLRPSVVGRSCSACERFVCVCVSGGVEGCVWKSGEQCRNRTLGWKSSAVAKATINPCKICQHGVTMPPNLGFDRWPRRSADGTPTCAHHPVDIVTPHTLFGGLASNARPMGVG
jgi:hypothetical protein